MSLIPASATITSLTPMVGIRLPPALWASWRAQSPSLGFVQMLSDQVDATLVACPLTLHERPLRLGSLEDLNPARLALLSDLTARLPVLRVSMGMAADHTTDRTAQMRRLVQQIDEVQSRLKRPLVLCDHDLWPQHTLIDVSQRSGCRLRLDLNRLLVRGLNRARQQGWQVTAGHPDTARALTLAQAHVLDIIWSMPPGLVAEVHLGGFRWPDHPDQAVMASNSQRISPEGWRLYEECVRHLGSIPTLIKWDVDLPPLAVLLDEARQAAQLAQHHLSPEHASEALDLIEA
jgi:uncharacterized protein (UPF0276 family)